MPRNTPLWPAMTPTRAPTTTNVATIAAQLVSSIRCPTHRRRAGSSVKAATSSSPPRAPTPRATPWTKLNPMRNRPISEMMTVMPANRTAARWCRPTGPSIVHSARRAARRGTGDDEQRVVDADAEADHRHHRRRERASRSRCWRGTTPRRCRAQQGRPDRQAHREDRPEGEDEDDHGRDQPVDLALGQLELGEQVAAVLDLEAFDGVDVSPYSRSRRRALRAR